MTQMQLPATFTADELSNEDYHASPGISCSGVKLIAERTPAHYWAKYMGPARIWTPRQPMIIGTAIHAATLEPAKFEQDYVVMPKHFASKTQKGYKAWKEEQSKVILSRLEYSNVLGMRAALMNHPEAGWLLADDPVFEQSYYAVEPETGAIVRCRTDFRTKSHWICDLKKCQDASDDAIAGTLGDYGYYIQDPYYRLVYKLATGIDALNFVLIFVEEDPPHCINVVGLEPPDFELGERMMWRGLETYAECLLTNKWPGLPTGAHTVGMRQWKRQQIDRLLLKEGF